MANIENIWLILQTSSKKNSGTSNVLELQAVTSGQDVELKTNNTTYTKKDDGINQSLSTGKATQFYWSQSSGFWSAGALTTDNISDWNLEIQGSDAYLPHTVWVITKDSNGNFDLVITDTGWNSSNCLSTDGSECPAASYEL